LELLLLELLELLLELLLLELELLKLLELELEDKSSIAKMARPPGVPGPGNWSVPVLKLRIWALPTSPLSKVSINLACQS